MSVAGSLDLFLVLSCSAQRGRVYLPQDELAAFGLSDDDIFAGQVTPKWRDFMRFQIQRARDYFDRAEAGVPELDAKSRWPVRALPFPELGSCTLCVAPPCERPLPRFWGSLCTVLW